MPPPKRPSVCSSSCGSWFASEISSMKSQYTRTYSNCATGDCTSPANSSTPSTPTSSSPTVTAASNTTTTSSSVGQTLATQAHLASQSTSSSSSLCYTSSGTPSSSIPSPTSVSKSNTPLSSTSNGGISSDNAIPKTTSSIPLGSSAPHNSSSSHTGAIVGGVVGGVVVICLGIIAIILCCRIRRRKRDDSDGDSTYFRVTASSSDRYSTLIHEQTQTGMESTMATPSHHSQSLPFSDPHVNLRGTSRSSSNALGSSSSVESEVAIEWRLYGSNEAYDGLQWNDDFMQYHEDVIVPAEGAHHEPPGLISPTQSCAFPGIAL